MRLLSSNEIIANLDYNLIKQNVVGIDVTGIIEVKYYNNDKCFIGIALNLGGVIKY